LWFPLISERATEREGAGVGVGVVVGAGADVGADADVGAGVGAGSGEVGVVADDDGVVAAAAAEYTLPEEKQQWEQAYAASDLWEAMGEEDGKDLRC